MEATQARTHLVVPFFDDSLRESWPLPSPTTTSSPVTPKRMSSGSQRIICVKRRSSQYGSSSISGTKRVRLFEDDDMCQSPEPIEESGFPGRSIKRSRSSESISTISSTDEPKTPRMQINDRDLEIEIDADIAEDPLDLDSNTPRSPSHLSVPPRNDENAILDGFLSNLIKNAEIIKQNAEALRTALSYERSCKLQSSHTNGKPCICRANTSLSVLNQYKRRQRELRLPILETLVAPQQSATMRRMQTPTIQIHEDNSSVRGCTMSIATAVSGGRLHPYTPRTHLTV